MDAGSARQLRGDLDAIVAKSLHADREQRYGSVAALADDLRRYLADEPILAAPVGSWSTVRKFLRRHSTASAAAAAAVLALLAFAGFAWRNWSLAHGDAARARVAAARAAARAQQLEHSVVRARRLESEAVAARDRLEAARHEIERSAAEGRQLHAYFEALFRDLRTRRPPDSPTTVRELLDAAAANLDGHLREHPAAEERLRLQIGSCYGSLRDFARAIPHLERSTELSAARLGTEDATALRIRTSLLRARVEVSDFRGALAELRRLRVVPTAHPDDDALIVLYHRTRAALFRRMMRKQDAEDAIEAAIARARTAFGDGDERTLALESSRLTIVGSVPLSRDDLATMRRIHQRLQNAAGPDEPVRCEASHNFGMALLEAREFREAIDVLDGAVTDGGRLFGRRNLSVLRARPRAHARASGSGIVKKPTRNFATCWLCSTVSTGSSTRRRSELASCSPTASTNAISSNRPRRNA